MRHEPPLTLTDEQQEIIDFPLNMKVNAVAGSGKSTTLIEYAAARPGARILYLGFNRSVRLEAQTRFTRHGLTGVDIHTAHSLAYRYVMRSGRYKLSQTGDLSIPDILTQCDLISRYGPKVGAMLAAHIRRLMGYFCNAEAPTLAELVYEHTIDPGDKKVRFFLAKYREVIYGLTQRLFTQMDEGKLAVTHDFYLKKFQLLCPALPYDYILFDEGQDASQTMLHVFLRQAAIKVIVGDQHQQIYSFRFAVNSLQRVQFPALNLTTSFRFGQPIADQAMCVLNWKRMVDPTYQAQSITGTRTPKAGLNPLHATIGRTNISVLAQAIESLCIREEIGSLYFEGQFTTYTYMDAGGSLFDILNLHLGKNHLVRSPLLASMGDIGGLKEYVDATGDAAMRLGLEIVKTYEADLFDFIRQIKEAHLPDASRVLADRIFSTVHRCKGLEYDAIDVCDDFIEERAILENLDKWAVMDKGERDFIETKAQEEINMLYVALTRTKKMSRLPPDLYLSLASWYQRADQTVGL